MTSAISHASYHAENVFNQFVSRGRSVKANMAGKREKTGGAGLLQRQENRTLLNGIKKSAPPSTMQGTTPEDEKGFLMPWAEPVHIQIHHLCYSFLACLLYLFL